jgi:hypothetical protein
MLTSAPGCTPTASLERSSISASRSAGSPTSMIGVPGATMRELSSKTFNTKPFTGARMRYGSDFSEGGL